MTLEIEKMADYILALKGNQGKLSSEVTTYFEDMTKEPEKIAALPFAETIDKNHGRLEIRRCWVQSDLSFLEHGAKWKNLSSLVKIESERTVNEKTSIEQRYYISSIGDDRANPKTFLKNIRSHWGIENNLHWTLDRGCPIKLASHIKS